MKRADAPTSTVMRSGGIRALEAAMHASRPADSLMDRAGKAVAALAITMTDERVGTVVVLAGPGNNGGDALVAARELHARGVPVRVALLDEDAHYKGAALLAWTLWQEVAGDAARPVDPVDWIPGASLIIDGLFGIGFNREPSDRARDWIVRVNAAACPVLAIDVPSGVDADTGRVADIAVEADRTITFLAHKPGLLTGSGLDHCGVVQLDVLGADRDGSVVRDVAPGDDDVGALNRPALFPLAPRRRDSHKGRFGSVAAVGGSDGMVGAILLAARMALHGGAGRVYVRLLAEHGPVFDAMQPELMLRASLDGLDLGALAIGPGLGSGDAGMAAVEHALAAPCPIVVDADALNLIASHEWLRQRLLDRAQGLPVAVLTPHPLEAARLLDIDVKEVQADRVAIAQRLARETSSIVILKGAGSVLADVTGAWTINPTGNPALATGGTGDVLCGLVAALLAQKIPPLAAARAATWAHGRAADALVAAGTGPVGLTPSELIPAIRRVLNELQSG